MQTDHSKAISGLSIATIVIASISIVLCIVGLVFVGIGGSAFNEFGRESVNEIMNDPYYGYSYDMDELSTDDIMALGNFGLILGGVGIVWEMVMLAVALVAGVLGLRASKDRSALGKAFGWGIAGAICSFLSGSIVTMVLLIIMAVYAYKDKNAPVNTYGMPGAQPYAGAPVAQPAVAPQPIVTQPPAQPVAATPAPQPQAQPIAQTPAQTPTPTQTTPQAQPAEIITAPPANAVPTTQTQEETTPRQQ